MSVMKGLARTNCDIVQCHWLYAPMWPNVKSYVCVHNKAVIAFNFNLNPNPG